MSLKHFAKKRGHFVEPRALGDIVADDGCVSRDQVDGAPEQPCILGEEMAFGCVEVPKRFDRHRLEQHDACTSIDAGIDKEDGHTRAVATKE